MGAAGNPHLLADAVVSMSEDDRALSLYAAASGEAAQLHSREKQARQMLELLVEISARQDLRSFK